MDDISGRARVSVAVAANELNVDESQKKMSFSHASLFEIANVHSECPEKETQSQTGHSDLIATLPHMSPVTTTGGGSVLLDPLPNRVRGAETPRRVRAAIGTAPRRAGVQRWENG